MLVTTAIDRRQPQEGAVALVGLDHHPLAGAEPGVGAVGVDDAAVDHGRDRARRLPARRRPGWWWWSCRACRRPRSTISAASARPASRRGGPPGCAARAPPATSGLSCLTAVETTTTCAAPRLSASWPMATGMPAARSRRDVGALGDVAALHRVAEIVQHLGDAGHADAADADEVDGADGEGQGAHSTGILRGRGPQAVDEIGQPPRQRRAGPARGGSGGAGEAARVGQQRGELRGQSAPG